MTITLSDLRLALRLVLRRPALCVGAVLSLALGIGANTAIFSVLHRVVLNPLPYAQPAQLVMVWETSADNQERWVAPANFVDWQRETTSFAALAAFDVFRPTLTRPAQVEGGASLNAGAAPEPEVVRTVSASGTFFTTLGVSAAMGRTLLPEDDAPGATAVAVLSEGLWRRAFGADSAIPGRTLALDGRPHVIVGVMPDSFESPLQSSAIDLWVNGDRGVPRTFPFGGDVTAVRDSHILFVLGRLADGVSREVAQQELTTLMQELSRRHPDTNAGLGAHVKSLHEAVVGDVARLVTLLQLAVGMMLLIACANVAHLLLGLAAARHSEMATRVALGAGRGRLVRQLLIETLVIAIPGGLLGLTLAVWGLELLVAAAPQGLPRVSEIAIDPVVLAFTTLVTLFTALLFGLGPAVQLSRAVSLAQAQSTTRVSGARRIRRWHHAIVITELAAAHVLLIGAGLLVSSLLAAQRVPLGFETTGRVAADLSLAPERYLRRPNPDEPVIDVQPKLQFVERVLTRVRQTPGVRRAAASFTSPLTGAPNRGIVVEGRPVTGPGPQDAADFQVVTPDFFHAMGATLARGRHFSEADTADTAPVTIVNQAFVDSYFAGVDPIGRRIQFGGTLSHEIVGIVGDMRYRSVETPADPTFYLPLTQNAERWPFLSITVQTSGDTTAAMTALRTAIREADGSQAVVRVRSFYDILHTALATRRFNTVLVIAFAGMALLLAAIGTYGVMSFAVSVRTRELGVRAALGASPGNLLRLVVSQGLKITAIALALGALGGIAVAGVMRSLLYEVAPRDPVTFLVVALTLGSAALLAMWLPARRAVGVNPITALREE
ncbi:MAG TPA: ABC transporter permease [Vicinamibacterales bacterium]|nr:ABC transporter permease [Vicinamibacterales bacterium]